MADFLQTAYEFYLKKGYAPHQAAALAGNSVNEANSPTQLGDNGSALGRFQWRGDRQKNLYKFAADNNLDPESDEGQLEFANHELSTTEKAAGDKLKNAPDLAAANDAVISYLRPGGYTPDNPQAANGYVNRYNSAASLVNATPMTQTLANLPTQTVNGPPNTPSVPPADPNAGLLAYTDMLNAGPQIGPQVGAPPQGLLAKYSPQDAVTKGLGLLASSQPRQQAMAPAPAAMQMPQVHRPDAGGMPNFVDPLLQKKLLGLLGEA